MNYIVLDIEATDQKPNEMIEIAAVKLNENLQLFDQFQSFIQPTHHPKLQWFIKKLTGIHQYEIDEAKHFPAVFEEFMNWAGEDSLFITWSNSDLYFLQSECTIHGITTNYDHRFVNIQQAVSSKLHSESVLNLTYALEILHFEFEGRPHRAFDDAYNTSKLFVYAMQTCGSIADIQAQQLPKQNNYNFNTQINLKDCQKINIRRYRTYIETLSMDEMKRKMTIFEELMTIERDKQEEMTSLYITLWQKRKVLKGILSYQQKLLSLQEADLTEKQLEDLLKSANILYAIRFKLLLKMNNEAKKTLKSLEKEIEQSRKYARQVNKTSYLHIEKESVLQQFSTLHSIYKTVLCSPYMNEKYKNMLTHGNKIVESYLELPTNQIA